MQIYKSNEAPTTSTPGCVGDYFIDITTDTTYKCTAVETASDTYGFLKITDATLGDSVYVWEKLGGGSEMFVVTMVEDSETGRTNKDKTYSEIAEAITSGKTVILKESRNSDDYKYANMYHLSAFSEHPEKFIVFATAGANDMGGAWVTSVVIRDDEQVYTASKML